MVSPMRMPRTVAANFSRAVIGHHDPAVTPWMIIARTIIIGLRVAVIAWPKVMPAIAVIGRCREMAPRQHRAAIAISAAVKRRSALKSTTAKRWSGGPEATATSATEGWCRASEPAASAAVNGVSASATTAKSATTTAAAVSTMLHLRDQRAAELLARRRIARADQ